MQAIKTIDYLEYAKVPPQSKELEKAVLGAIMLDKNAFDIAAETLTEECFYVPAYQKIFKTCQRLSERNVQPELLSVVEELKFTNDLEAVGGPYEVTKLTNYASINLEDHCRIIKQKYVARELIKISGETVGLGYDETVDAFDLLDTHEAKLSTLTTSFIKGNFQNSETLSIRAMERIDFLRLNREQLSGVPTGFKPLDRLTNGWQATDLIILAARPSVGKTAFALNLACNAAVNAIKPTPVAFFSLEMSSGQLVQRILSSESGIHLEKITRGRLYDDDYDKVTVASFRFAEMPIYIDDTAALNIFEFKSKARRLVRKHKVGLIIIDYLQLMRGISTEKNTNREQEVSTISRNLKALAKQLEVPIIALSQLSRAIETRKEKPEPMLSDLRESGAIEQDADMVMFLYRPDYQMQADEVDPSIRGEAMLKVAKHRNGDLDKIPFRTDLSIQKWYDVDFNNQPSNFKPIPRTSGNFDDGFDNSTPF